METDCPPGGTGHCNDECPFWENNKCCPLISDEKMGRAFETMCDYYTSCATLAPGLPVRMFSHDDT
ncbi:hypothetical protein LCGC14_2519840 [marine sediment metagenome]|uniref:Uncharacterized protein n=1 Tax=marine sediment metagenome TaxID=412755 RepID=A0A0F9AX45_9ZZZZ